MRSPFFLLLLLASAPGCNMAQLKGAPDASPNCGAPVLEFPCKAQASGPGCADDLDAGAVFNRDFSLEGGSFPQGCTVIVNDPTPDEQNQCTQLGTCRCAGDDAGNYGWACRP